MNSKIFPIIALCLIDLALGQKAYAEQKSAPPNMQASKPANLEKNAILILVRSTLLALDHANKTGNYTTFRDLGSPNFSLANDPSRLSEIFSSLRRDRLDLSGASVMEPTIIKQQIIANGMLDIAGFFPSASQQLNFEILYEPVNGQWRLFGITANTGPTAPSAPAPLQSSQDFQQPNKK